MLVFVFVVVRARALVVSCPCPCPLTSPLTLRLTNTSTNTNTNTNTNGLEWSARRVTGAVRSLFNDTTNDQATHVGVTDAAHMLRVAARHLDDL
jgi:hypothetical protein